MNKSDKKIVGSAKKAYKSIAEVKIVDGHYQIINIYTGVKHPFIDGRLKIKP